MSKITSYFSPAKSLEDTIPSEWLTSPLPCKNPRPKRPVGRPPKRKLDVISVDDDDDDQGFNVEPADIELTVKRGKYKRYSVAEKMEILKVADSIGVSAVSDRFNIPASTISTWRKKLKVEKDKGERELLERKTGSGRTVSYPMDLEMKLVTWIIERRDIHLPVSRECVKKEALKVIRPSNPEFKASNGWLEKFMRRNQLSTRRPTSLSQKLPEDLDQRLSVFYKHLREVAGNVAYDEEMILNMDEVPMVFEVVSKKTVDGKGKKDVKLRTAGGEKKHFTVVLCVAADGTILPSMVIFKGKRQPKVTVPDGWLILSNDTAWMREDVMLKWINQILKPYTQRRPSLLIMDSFSAHVTQSVRDTLKSVNCQPAIIPGGCTSKAQPLDVVLNKPFKDQLRKKWVVHTRSAGSEKSVCPSKDIVTEWMTESLESLPKEMVKKSFQVTGIMASLEGDDVSSSQTSEGPGHFQGDDNEEDDSFIGFDDDDLVCDDPFVDI